MEQKYEIGNFITELRKEKKLTQSKLGELVGVTNKAISKWENGQGLPEPIYMKKLCEVLEISMEELLNGKRNPILENEILDDLSRLEHVYKYYNNEDKIEVGLSDITVNFKLGEIVAITGISGAGKTTFINMIGGLDSFENGEIYIESETLSKYDKADYENYRKKYVSIIFQNYGILESYSIIDNLIIMRLLMGDTHKEAKKKALEILEQLGLLKFKNKKASKLSSGQKQKLSVGRAILKNSPIIIGDEITANLDQASAKEILKFLIENSKDKLVLLVTHHFDQIKDYVTRKITLSEGKITEDIQLKKQKSISYTPVILKEKKSLYLGLSLGLKQLKCNIKGFLIYLLSMLLCAVLLFALNSFFDYAISDADRGLYAKTDPYIEVFKDASLSYQDLKQLEEISGVKGVYTKNTYKRYARIISHDGSFPLEIDNTLAFGQISVSGTNEYVSSLQEGAYYPIQMTQDNAYSFVFQLNKIEKLIRGNSCMYMSMDSLNLIHKILADQGSFKTENTTTSIKLLPLMIDLNARYTELYAPITLLKGETPPEDLTYFWSTKKDIIANLYFEDVEYTRCSYILFEELPLNENRFFLKCALDQMNSINEIVETIGYKALMNKEKSFNLNEENYFQSNTLFFLVDIAIAIILYLLLRVTFQKVLLLRKKEFAILKKIGFTHKTIFIHSVFPIVLSTILTLLLTFSIYLIRPLHQWFYFVIPFSILLILLFFILRNLYEKKEQFFAR